MNIQIHEKDVSNRRLSKRNSKQNFGDLFKRTLTANNRDKKRDDNQQDNDTSDI